MKKTQDSSIAILLLVAIVKVIALVPFTAISIEDESIRPLGKQKWRVLSGRFFSMVA